MTDTNSDAKKVGAEARDDASRATHRAADDARSFAHEATERVRDEAYNQGDRAKKGVASEMSGIADALRKAADDMRSGSPQERTLGQLAGTLADASEAIRDRDLGEIATDVSGFARRNPLAFLGGAALAGFAATRFAKASARKPYGGSHGYEPDGESDDPVTRPAPTGTTSDSIPAPATRPATTTTTGAGSVASPAVETTPHTTGER